jgi:hypothetical protein
VDLVVAVVESTKETDGLGGTPSWPSKLGENAPVLVNEGTLRGQGALI